jgi:Glycosyl hydrolases family 16
MRRPFWAALLAVAVGTQAPTAHSSGALFFDDFNHADPAALRAQGWTVRNSPGHPGVPGARWDPQGVELTQEPPHSGNGVLRLHASTDGTPGGTRQSQLCRAQQFLWGTTSARVRFSDVPLAGADGDPVVQAFFQVSPLRFDYDPLFSELDWEYLPNGGWGSQDTRLFAVAWQTVRIEPWDAHNLAQEIPGTRGGRWHQLTVQATPNGSHWFIDGRAVASHAGRTVPRQAMGVAFSHWFSPTGLQPPSSEQRRYAFEVDWVLHIKDEVLSAAHMARRVRALRQQKVAVRDTLPPATTATRCDF